MVLLLLFAIWMEGRINHAILLNFVVLHLFDVVDSIDADVCSDDDNESGEEKSHFASGSRSISVSSS